MSELLKTTVRKKCYLDSVALMRYSKTLAAQSGVLEAAMMMGTPSNKAIMHNAGLLNEAETDAAAGDLIISVRAQDEASAEAALTLASSLLDTPSGSTSDASQWRPKSIRSAVQMNSNANLALISVPGDFAISEARKAIRRGLNVMIFSDNVPLEQEVLLKQEAATLGTLVMGPDCGTAIINGTPLAFANVVARGDIGIIGASGTGIQEVSCLIAREGRGISHAIGVGGRDLKEAVAGISTKMAMDLLEYDPATKHIVLISKPPSEAVAEAILAKAAQSKKSFTICFIGGQKPALASHCSWASSLEAAAFDATATVRSQDEETATVQFRALAGTKKGQLIRGLFCGGTLCAEAQVMFKHAGVTLSSNAPIPGVSETVENHTHTLIDLGSDEYTKGKPHPMIDPSVRDASMAQALQEDRVGVVLIDLVLGYGAHANPAGHLVEQLQQQDNLSSKLIIASVTGTDADPQRRSVQVRALKKAGILVTDCNASAARLALAAVSEG